MNSDAMSGIKPMVFMIATLVLGVLGSLLRGPVWGLTIYYIYAVLRPQFLWQWALPEIPWSFIVACSVFVSLAISPPGRPAGLEARGAGSRLGAAHKAVLLFGGWVCLTYLTARVQSAAYPVFVEYLKIFAIYAVGAFVLRTVGEIWTVFLATATILGYIALEMNLVYLQSYYLYLYRLGYCGLDNNGAGLMLAMGVPLCFYAWEGTTSKFRWVFLGLIPVIMHAVFTSYSRGAMISMFLGMMYFLVRTRHKAKVAILLVCMAALVPIMAGQEIQRRFESTAEYDTDASANSRFTTWGIAWRMALENPVFGMGIRNSNLYTYDYGADMHGRTIHSQYLQTAADSGLVALALYLIALFITWRTVCRVMRETKYRTDREGRRAYAIAAGVEGSMLVFCFGAAFLSLENFETPYIMLLLGAQLPLALRPAPEEVVEPESALPEGAFIPSYDVHGVTT
jgi:probable O-glycosylation ligase (exosortase A-associated)